MWFDIIKNAEPSSREVLQGYFTSLVNDFKQAVKQEGKILTDSEIQELVISYIQEELPLDSKNPWTAWRDNKVLVV
tara:strand:- start:164 stop:391 length:228 start_codon:yes stop_codon:yes gene_type:complete